MSQPVRKLFALRYDVVVATFVGVCALGVSAYTAHVQRQQVRAMVWPILEFGNNNDPFIALTLSNKGVGPAIIRRAKILVDGRPINNWYDIVQKLQGPGAHNSDIASIVGHALSPGETINLFVPYGSDDKPMHAPFTEPAASQMNKARFRVSVEICFSSTLGECWMLRQGQDGRNELTEVAACPAPSAEDLRD